jgi:hypothetical protein
LQHGVRGAQVLACNASHVDATDARLYSAKEAKS